MFFTKLTCTSSCPFAKFDSCSIVFCSSIIFCNIKSLQCLCSCSCSSWSFNFQAKLFSNSSLFCIVIISSFCRCKCRYSRLKLIYCSFKRTLCFFRILILCVFKFCFLITCNVLIILIFQDSFCITLQVFYLRKQCSWIITEVRQSPIIASYPVCVCSQLVATIK